MKQTTRILLSFALLTMFTVVAASAEEVREHVPFDFVAGSHLYSAGEYVVEVNLADDPALLTIQTRDGRLWKAVFVEPDLSRQPAPESKLVFETYRGRHYLSEVLVGGDYIMWKIPPNDLHREMVDTSRMEESGPHSSRH